MKEKRRQKHIRPKRAQRNKRRGYRKVRNSTSIYFLLWAVFTALSLLIVLLFGITQRVVTTQTYTREAAKEVREKGAQIHISLLYEVPPDFTDTPSAYLRRLSAIYDVHIFILSPSGEVVFPQEPDLGGETDENPFDFHDKTQLLLEQLAGEQGNVVVYEGVNEYVYGAKISLFGQDNYLYVSKSLDLMNSVIDRLGTHILIISTFMFVLSFAISGAVAGWITKPIIEMTQKASLFARGDFTVDFHGSDYGEEMVMLAETLNYARDELSKTDAMQKELIANVSHDFKTPLTMIKGYASMIMEISGDIPEKRNKHAQVIVDEADRLTSLVADLLELSKMQSGIAELDYTVFNMSAYLQEVLARFGEFAQTQGYVFETEIDKGLYTQGDELKLGQVLYNLIGNAVNYTGEDKRVTVRLQKQSDTVFRFSVTDTGKGIKQEDIPTIWERYYRSKETHKRPVQGTGLGLSIVKTILVKHRFVFGVDSEIGKGSTFFVDFPLVTEEEKD